MMHMIHSIPACVFLLLDAMVHANRCMRVRVRCARWNETVSVFLPGYHVWRHFPAG